MDDSNINKDCIQYVYDFVLKYSFSKEFNHLTLLIQNAVVVIVNMEKMR